MIVKALKKFGDKTTGATYAQQKKIEVGQIFECDDELAEERIQKGLVKKATKKEEKEYVDSIATFDDDDLKKKDDNTEDIKPLEECTDDELWEIARNENINIDDSVSREELIETINKVREEKLKENND